jgi:hypothetical protein
MLTYYRVIERLPDGGVLTVEHLESVRSAWKLCQPSLSAVATSHVMLLPAVRERIDDMPDDECLLVAWDERPGSSAWYIQRALRGLNTPFPDQYEQPQMVGRPIQG